MCHARHLCRDLPFSRTGLCWCGFCLIELDMEWRESLTSKSLAVSGIGSLNKLVGRGCRRHLRSSDIVGPCIVAISVDPHRPNPNSSGDGALADLRSEGPLRRELQIWLCGA
jgi:hypothetical protein